MKKVIKFLIVIFLLLTVVAVGFMVYTRYFKDKISLKEKPVAVQKMVDEEGNDVTFDFTVFMSEGGVFEQDEVVGKIGDMEVLGRTMNMCIWGGSDMGEYINTEDFDSVYEGCKKKIAEDFIYIQEYKGDDIKYINQEDVSAVKSLSALVEEARLGVGFSDVYTVDYEAISIWFYNWFVPEMGIEEAKQVVEAKIGDIHAELLSGRLENLEAAGEVIRNDTELEEIDGSYVGNSYWTGENVAIVMTENFPSDVVRDLLFKECSFTEEVKGLSVGEYSDVLLCREEWAHDEPNYYVILALTNVNEGSWDSAEEDEEALLNKYDISWSYE